MQVYVHEQGAVVRKKGGLLWVTHGSKTLHELPLMKVEQLVLIGNIQLTTQAAKYMLTEGIDTVFLSSRGTYLGRLDRNESKFAALRQQQYRLSLNPQRCLEIARQMILGKIHNQRVVLQRRAEEDVQSRTALEGMMSMKQRLEEAGTLDQLRGFEGKAAAFYFQGIRNIFPSNWGFERRQYYPAPDPANALLSFAYMLLNKDMTNRLQLVGLDPAVGFFHVLEDNRTSLVLDLMEEFRPSIADIVVLNLVSRNLIHISDFEETGDAGMPIRLRKAAAELVISAYEERLSSKVFHPMVEGETAYRQAIEYQARQIRWVIEGKAIDYQSLQLQ